MRSPPATGSEASTAGAYPATLTRLVGRWLDAHPSLPVIASGMVGSRHGWREAAYVKCPAGPRDVASQLAEVEADGHRVALAPGLVVCRRRRTAGCDAGRGDGNLRSRRFRARASLCLPGSHSKWARVEGERVVAFKTFVTGELFAALRDHTVLGAFARAAPDRAPGKAFAPGTAFALGVERGAAAADNGKSGLLGLMFGARTLPLMGKLDPDDSGEYLSGLLIGAEIGEGRRLYPGEAPHVAGAEALVRRYIAAFEALGVPARAAPPRAAARGLFRIARDGGLL